MPKPETRNILQKRTSSRSFFLGEKLFDGRFRVASTLCPWHCSIGIMKQDLAARSVMSTKSVLSLPTPTCETLSLNTEFTDCNCQHY